MTTALSADAFARPMPAPTSRADDEDLTRLKRFGEAIDKIKKDVEAEVGQPDLDRVKRLDRFSHVMEGAGRVLLHVSFEPIAFTLGVTMLWIHKQLQATEIGHTALHGVYDDIEGADAY